MRTTIAVYRQLYSYLLTLPDPEVDHHFSSVVYLGMGFSNIILSLLPSRLLGLAELFGYKGERKLGLELLMKAGGWTDKPEPSVSAEDEGLRRSVCDMSLMIFHLVMSSFTFDGVDVSVAKRILEWNLKRYPDGMSYYLLCLYCADIFHRCLFPFRCRPSCSHTITAHQGDCFL
jgi:hypothetical protein